MMVFKSGKKVCLRQNKVIQYSENQLFMETLIFKTNIEMQDLPRIKQRFDALTSIKKWSIDFEDCDRVLRIESPVENTLPVVISEVESMGLVCIDLGD
jgi:hypothetical protein